MDIPLNRAPQRSLTVNGLSIGHTELFDGSQVIDKEPPLLVRSLEVTWMGLYPFKLEPVGLHRGWVCVLVLSTGSLVRFLENWRFTTREGETPKTFVNCVAILASPLVGDSNQILRLGASFFSYVPQILICLSILHQPSHHNCRFDSVVSGHLGEKASSENVTTYAVPKLYHSKAPPDGGGVRGGRSPGEQSHCWAILYIMKKSSSRARVSHAYKPQYSRS